MNNINPMNKRFQIILFIVTLFLIFTSYLLLQPRISNLFPFVRNHRLSAFIQNTINNDSISVQEFWQLREFYSPGFIQLKQRDILFTSDKIVSRETLVDKKITLGHLVTLGSDWKIVYRNRNEMIVVKGNETLIYFIKPILEMKKANGFFDYNDKDKKMLENKNWYVVTKIQK